MKTCLINGADNNFLTLGWGDCPEHTFTETSKLTVMSLQPLGFNFTLDRMYQDASDLNEGKLVVIKRLEDGEQPGQNEWFIRRIKRDHGSRVRHLCFWLKRRTQRKGAKFFRKSSETEGVVSLVSLRNETADFRCKTKRKQGERSKKPTEMKRSKTKRKKRNKLKQSEKAELKRVRNRNRKIKRPFFSISEPSH